MPQASTLRPSRSRIPIAAHAEAPAFAPAHSFAMLSDRGRVRQANEDACGARPERGAFVVCDGMGGAAAGEVASHLAMRAFLDALEASGPDSLAQLRRIPPKAVSSRASGATAVRSLRNGPQPPSAGQYPANHPHARLEEAVRAANHAVYRHSQKSRSLRGMGTTLVALLLDTAGPMTTFPTLWLAHVGDSRCYCLRAGTLHQLTQDHSLVEEQIQAGLLSRVQAGSSPIRNIITRAIGSLPTVETEIAAHAAQPGDLYLLASDGLTHELEDAEIAGILNRSAGATLEDACHALIDAANANGGGDNITALLVRL